MTVKSLTLAWSTAARSDGSLDLPSRVTLLTPAKLPVPPQLLHFSGLQPVSPARLLDAHLYRFPVLRYQDVKASCLSSAQCYLSPSLGFRSPDDSAQMPSPPPPV